MEDATTVVKVCRGVLKTPCPLPAVFFTASSCLAALWCVHLQAEAVASTVVSKRGVPVLLLGEDWYTRRLEDSDLHQSAVSFHRLPIIIGYQKQLQRAREHTHKQHTNAGTKVFHSVLFFYHTTTRYTNNSLSEVARHLFVDVFSILIKTDWQNGVWRAACKAPTERVWMYWSTFIHCGEWGLGKVGGCGVAGEGRDRQKENQHRQMFEETEKGKHRRKKES